MSYRDKDEWTPCLAGSCLEVAFFDGIRIDTDRITDPRSNRVLPILEEEQVLMCRSMRDRGIFDRLKEQLPKNKQKPTVLDIGTGSGVFAIWAAAHGCAVTAVDISIRAIQFARHNAAHSSNRNQIDLSGGTIEFQRCDIRTFAEEHAKRRNPPFDMVFLSPPYNPTVPQLAPARHAAAGRHGLDEFRKQLPRAWSLVREEGHIVGNVMTFHEAGRANDWWKRELDRGLGTMLHGNSCALEYAPMLSDASEYPAEGFLRAQYELFLDERLRMMPSAKETEAYIQSALDGSIEPDVKADPVFGLFYFEIRKERASSVPNLSSNRIRSDFLQVVPSKTWQDRIDLHRAIVEHTSGQCSFPAPVLFLSNDSTPPLPRASVASAAKTDASAMKDIPEELFEKSPLSTVGRWMTQTRLLGADKFDFVLIDVGPWFDSWEGRRALKQEAVLYARKDYKRTEDLLLIMNEYQANTKAQQIHNIGPFLHPYFSGQGGRHAWGNIYCRIMDHPNIPPHLVEDGLIRNDEWLDRLDAESKSQLVSTKKGFTQFIQPQWDSHVSAVFASQTLKDLAVPNLSTYLTRIKNRERYSGNLILEEHALLEKDFEWVHMIFHARLRKVLRLDQDIPDAADDTGRSKTILVGAPLRFALSDEPRNETRLPKDYRGGLWVFAGTRRSSIGPKDESLILDVARLGTLLEMSSVETNAASALIEGLNRDVHSTFSHEIKYVTDGIREDRPDYLEGIRRHLNMLTLTPREFERHDIGTIWDDITGLIGNGFAEGTTWHQFMENQLRFAIQTDQLQSSIIHNDAVKKDTALPPIHWLPSGDLRISEDFQSLDSAPPKRLEDLCSFSQALIAAFRNVLKHCNPDKPNITIGVSSEGLEIRNYRTDYSIKTAKGSFDDTSMLGTQGVLRQYAKRYSEADETAVSLKPCILDDTMFCTKMPLPQGLIEDVNL